MKVLEKNSNSTGLIDYFQQIRKEVFITKKVSDVNCRLEISS